MSRINLNLNDSLEKWQEQSHFCLHLWVEIIVNNINAISDFFRFFILIELQVVFAEMRMDLNRFASHDLQTKKKQSNWTGYSATYTIYNSMKTQYYICS